MSNGEVLRAIPMASVKLSSTAASSLAIVEMSDWHEFLRAFVGVLLEGKNTAEPRRDCSLKILAIVCATAVFPVNVSPTIKEMLWESQDWICATRRSISFFLLPGRDLDVWLQVALRTYRSCEI